MPRKTEPIDDESLAGLIMAVTAEAGRAGWGVRYAIQDNGDLVLHLHHPEKSFFIIHENNGSSCLTIHEHEPIVIPSAEEVIPDA